MIKKLASCIREFKKDTILTPVFVMGEVILEVVIPYLLSNLIDFGIDGGNMGYILKMGAALLISSFISLAFGALAGRSAAIASCGFARNLRHDLFYRVQGFSFANIDRFSSASLVTRLTTDVSNVQMAFQMSTRMAFRAPLMLIFSMFMAFRVNSSLALIFLGCVPVLALGLWLIIRYAHPIFERVFKTYDKLNRVVQENLRGIRVVKAFVREEHEQEKFQGISKSIYNDFSKAERGVSFNAPLMQTCVYACMLLISWFGARLIVQSGNDPAIGMSTGQLMSMMTYVMQILMSLMMLSMIFVMMTISRASAERVVEVLSEESDLHNPENPVMAVEDGSISFDNVSFSYSKDPAKCCLTDIDLHIASGQTVGILGVTGSAKSSLVQLIPRLYDVTAGTLKVGGVDVRDYDVETLRNAVAMVLQKNVLFSGSIKENLRWGNPEATDEELIEACRVAQADEFIRTFPDGYDTHIEQGGTNVSGGQKQRLCIARALLKKPKILILDDSTSAVDTRTDALIREGFSRDIPGTTKLIIAQRVASVEDADLIVLLDNGRIIAKGSHDELMKNSEIYREIYESQRKGASDDE